MADNLDQRMRELLRALRECQQPGSTSKELEDSLVLAMTQIALNRPSRMSNSKEACTDVIGEEAEQFFSLARALTLENRDGFSRQQRLKFGELLVRLKQDLERFINDGLLIIDDREEIRRRIEVS